MEKVKRDTTVDLFKGIMKMTRDSGLFHEIDNILEYDTPVNHDLCMHQIANSQFRVVFEIRLSVFCGVFIGAYLIGTPFERDGEGQRLHFGTLKTAEYSLHTMEIMGRACGLLLFFANAYIAKNWQKFEPDPEEVKAISKS